MLLLFYSKLSNLERYYVNFYYVLTRYNFRFFSGIFPNYPQAKESLNRVEFYVFFQVKIPDKMTSRFQNSTPKFKIKDENFNDCVSISTNSSISSIKSYRASIKNDSSDSDTDTFDDDSQSMTSTIANNDRESNIT